jgi:hypothetical protein
MKMTPYVFIAAQFVLCGALSAQDSIPGAPDPTIEWTSGTLGIAGGRLKMLNGAGKLSFTVGVSSPDGAVSITGYATSDSNGTITYSNVASATTKTEYYEGGPNDPDRHYRVWKSGAIIGASQEGHHIAVLKGAGKFYIYLAGVQVSGDVTADGKGGYLYTQVGNVTASSDYCDGQKWWNAGAVLEITEKGTIRVISGIPKQK